MALQQGSLSRITNTFAINVATNAPGSAWDSFSPLSRLLTIATVNNKATFEASDASADQGGVRKVLGDATDAGLLRFCDRVVDVEDLRASFNPVFAIPFNSKNKWALTMTAMPGAPNSHLVLIKGAPEYVLQRCATHWHRNAAVPINDEFMEDMNEAYSSVAGLAERVIGHAYKVRHLNHCQLAICLRRCTSCAAASHFCTCLPAHVCNSFQYTHLHRC